MWTIFWNSWTVLINWREKIVIGSHLKSNFKFCGMEIKSKPSGDLQIRVADQKEKWIDKIPRMMGVRGQKVSKFQESLIWSQIGAIQWFAATSRPDLCYLLKKGLSRVNAEKDTMAISWTNSAVQRFKDHRNSIFQLVPLRGQIDVQTMQLAMDRAIGLKYLLFELGGCGKRDNCIDRQSQPKESSV